ARERLSEAEDGELVYKLGIVFGDEDLKERGAGKISATRELRDVLAIAKKYGDRKLAGMAVLKAVDGIKEGSHMGLGNYQLAVEGMEYCNDTGLLRDVAARALESGREDKYKLSLAFEAAMLGGYSGFANTAAKGLAVHYPGIGVELGKKHGHNRLIAMSGKTALEEGELYLANDAVKASKDDHLAALVAGAALKRRDQEPIAYESALIAGNLELLDDARRAFRKRNPIMAIDSGIEHNDYVGVRDAGWRLYRRMLWLIDRKYPGDVKAILTAAEFAKDGKLYRKAKKWSKTGEQPVEQDEGSNPVS
ncbi:MAG: hypothetical protein HY367_00585, partial [Candidatus Aenigmarchaeota archaeon]|nr:hypothetical protein [Candidatus Aenigmarchaeota archaeon]